MGNPCIIMHHHVDEDRIYFQTPFHEQFKERFKETFQHPDRQWHPDKIMWSIDTDCLDALEDLLTIFFPDIDVQWEEIEA